MKILFLTSNDLNNPKRGTPIRILNFIEQLQLYGHEVTVVSKSFGLIDNVNFIPKPKGSALARLLFLSRLIKEKEIDYVFTATTVDIKMVVLLKIFRGVKIAIDIHGLSYEEDFYFKKISYFEKKIKNILFKFFLHFFNTVFVVSYKAKKYFVNDNRNIHVVYGGASLEHFPICKSRDSGTSLEIGYMGNTREYQGLKYLLDAVELFVKKGNILSLKLVVSEDTSNLWEMLSKRKLLRYTDIHHNVTHKDVFSFFSNTTAFVIPRPSLPLTEYAFPSKLTECLASGRLVITTSVGPVNELLSNRKNCLIIDPGSPKAILSALEEVQSLSLDERKAIGDRGRKIVEERLQWIYSGEIISKALI